VSRPIHNRAASSIEQEHCAATDLGTEVGVARRHFHGRVTEEFLDCPQRHPAHGEMTRERVTEHVPSDTSEIGGFAGSPERAFALGFGEVFSVIARKNELSRIA